MALLVVVKSWKSMVKRLLCRSSKVPQG
uniref:Uncharacterized protein n=1 Tax=Arundo donax TaxID=35708 RepID=A0A0A9HJ34_ARUDO